MGKIEDIGSGLGQKLRFEADGRVETVVRIEPYTVQLQDSEGCISFISKRQLTRWLRDGVVEEVE